jgi:hypothetical protein
MNERSAYRLSFPLNVLSLLVVLERDEAAVPEVKGNGVALHAFVE